MKWLPAALLLVLVALPARGILLDSGNGNTTPPPDDPGWVHVGEISTENAVYLGYGWGLTAAHVSTTSGPAIFDGVQYPVEPGTTIVLKHDATTDADLKVFRMDPYPTHLPVLSVRAGPLPVGQLVTMIGTGFDRGPALPGGNGWFWAGTKSKRWGTNLVLLPSWVPPPIAGRVTRSIVTEFDAAGTPDECTATTGDSGGGLFVDTGGGWELAGIQVALSIAQAGASTHGDAILSADLSFYRDALLDLVRPCDDGRDNDGDGAVDWPADPGCAWAGDRSEAFECADGIDNDLDFFKDLNDPDCSSPTDDLEAPDLDGDLVADSVDDCLGLANPAQLDTNRDGYGNRCDADLTNDGIVAGTDFLVLAEAWGTIQGDPGFDPDADLTGDGVIGGTDFILLVSGWGAPPGPSGLACAGSVPCP